ncbi:MAG TPA: hypothetical protein VGO35_12025 [Gammaproteobacteria bacterium]|jgi:hypothetical protein|nr:hypothetical protein [Gammaproteobacteria bacterium]
MFDWLGQPQRQKAPVRHARRRRAVERMLPSAALHIGGDTRLDPFSLYPCTRMHGADFEAEFHADAAAGDLHHL